MSWRDIFEVLAVVVLLVATVPALGRYIAAVYGSRADGTAPGDRVFLPIERRLYRAMQIDSEREQRWNVYALSLLAFALVSMLGLYVMLRVQGSLPVNPTGRGAMSPTGAFNVAVSFVTNTNWQWYSGEVALSHLTQMLGLAVQNFVSAGVGLAVIVAIIRGIARTGGESRGNGRELGNFWVDLTRGTLRILLPMSFLFALVLTSQGVVQNFDGDTPVALVDTVDGGVDGDAFEQTIPGGPVASQAAIKQLGTNGGGFYNANSAHPFENPNGFTNLLNTWSLLVIPFALVVAFGILIGDRRQARLLMAVMAGVLVVMGGWAIMAETTGNPALSALGVDQSVSAQQGGGNMEGKEVRIGTAACGLYAAATTGTSNGSVNCMHDSFTPLGGLSPMLSMMFGEVSPGGIGVGLMGLLINALLAVFIAGLMIGRTPEFLGKKIQAAEMKLVTLYILAMPAALLGFAAASMTLASAQTFQPGPHGLSEVLYNFASAANNNGSAFAYQSTGTDWYTITQGLAMLVGRFGLIIPALAIAGSLASKPIVPTTNGTLPTHTPLFGALIGGVVVIVSGLTFFPALALGPILEHLSL